MSTADQPAPDLVTLAAVLEGIAETDGKLSAVASCLRTHRCADHAPTALPDPITAAEAAELPDDAVIVEATSETDPTPKVGEQVRSLGFARRRLIAANAEAWWTVLYRPEPEPLPVSATV